MVDANPLGRVIRYLEELGLENGRDFLPASYDSLPGNPFVVYFRGNGPRALPEDYSVALGVYPEIIRVSYRSGNEEKTAIEIGHGGELKYPCSIVDVDSSALNRPLAAASLLAYVLYRGLEGGRMYASDGKVVYESPHQTLELPINPQT